jgi:AcrR family transcriptional regulator
MREIAARAGLNHSTLHYYFAGKEALISGVMDFIVQELSLGREKAGATPGLSPREELTSHFVALLRQAREQPDMFVVLAEINARSARDRGIRAVLNANERIWKRFIIEILRRGVESGDFDPALDIEAASEAVAALIRGLNLGSSGDLARAERALRQLTAWLVDRK